MNATMHDIKNAQPDHAIHDALVRRFSPYRFSQRAVPSSDLWSLFEAARWAPSSYNEQPWRYVVATREQGEAHERLASCLVEGNQVWARQAPVLALAVARLAFEHNGKPNKAAHHDLGLAAANLTVEATQRGLAVHQMGGILPDRARKLYDIPEGFEPFTALAIGYLDDNAGDPDDPFAQRDQTPRQRRPLSELVFGERWSSPFSTD